MGCDWVERCGESVVLQNAGVQCTGRRPKKESVLRPSFYQTEMRGRASLQVREESSEGEMLVASIPLLIPRYKQIWTTTARPKSRVETRPTGLTTTAKSGDLGPVLFRGQGAGREIGTEETAEIGTEETAGGGNGQHHQVPAIHPHLFHPMHHLIPAGAGAGAVIESKGRRNAIIGARVTRETRIGIEITDGRNQAKRAINVIGTARRIRSRVSMIENIVERGSPSAMMIHLHQMMIQMFDVPPFLARRSRCTLKRMKMIWCEKRQGKNCCGS